MNRRLGILGGTFDPIHIGHLDVAAAAAARLDLSELLIVPSHVPPHRTAPVASAFHRFAMTAIAVGGRSGWQASDIELREPSYSYTADTLRRLQGQGYLPSELFFVTGADAFSGIRTWKDFPALLDLAHFVVVSRPGVPVDPLVSRFSDLAGRIAVEGRVPATGTSVTFVDAPTTDVSSTAIRDRLTQGRSIAGLVTDGVRLHIEQHGLYASLSASRHGHAELQPSPAGRLHGQD